MTFNKAYFDTEGPLGIPMKDAQATMLENLLKTLPEEDRQITRAVTLKAPSEVMDGERSDVSWISTEDIDREREVVIAKGMNDSHFRLNPIVTMQHCYWSPPVGKSLWRKRIKDGDLVGIKAKTQYPSRPAEWPQDQEWEPDTVLSLIKAGMLMGKSVGFLRTKSHSPTPEEIKKNPSLAECYRIIDEWLLIEYACTFLPMNQNAIVEAVSKSMLPPTTIKRLGIEIPAIAPITAPPTGSLIPFTPMGEIEKAIQRTVSEVNLKSVIEKAQKEAIEQFRGRV